MDILVKTQASGDIVIILPLMINTGAPDTGLSTPVSFVIKAVNPDGSENTSFTAPTVSELIASSGIYKMIFPAAAANKLFVLADELNPYTLLVKSTTAGSTGYRAVRVYCVSRLPGEIAKASDLAAVDSTVNTLPTLAVIEASTVLAKDATVAKSASVPTLAQMEASSVLAKEATVAARPVLATIEGSSILAKEATVTARPTLTAIEASTVLAKDATVAKAATVPTLAQIETSTVLAKEATLALVKKFIKNKKTLTESGGVYSLVIYDDNDIDEILRKTIKDISGADITAIGAGVIARETKSSV